MRTPRMWTDSKISAICTIQRYWRGYSVRSWLATAGPGVLKRSLCHNTEELVTLDEKTRVSPLDYFSFVETDKVYWFDIRTLAEYCVNKLTPTNPYTRQPLSIDTRQRLRKLCIRRERRKIPNVHNQILSQTYTQAAETTWITVSQILTENGFFDMSHEYFTALNRTQQYIFTVMLQQDMRAWAAEHTSPASRRHRYTYWITRILTEYVDGANVDRMSHVLSRVLLTILNDYPDPYPICFIIMSCLHRL